VQPRLISGCLPPSLLSLSLSLLSPSFFYLPFNSFFLWWGLARYLQQTSPPLRPLFHFFYFCKKKKWKKKENPPFLAAGGDQKNGKKGVVGRDFPSLFFFYFSIIKFFF
jgi:hypothetical protein